MKTFTIEDIRNWNPCYDPNRYLPEDWEGTTLDILKHKEIPPQDKFWVVCREELIDEKTLRLFAVWCARQVEHLMTDERSKRALDVAEAYAHGNATDNELAAAWDVARDVARDAAWAAWAAAKDAARAAVWAAAKDAAWDARAAARAAAGAAAWAAAGAAARDARDAARDARDGARQKQVEKLIEMVRVQSNDHT